MPPIDIYFPEEILKKIDNAARKHGISRNKYFLKACEEALEKKDGAWPEDFFSLKLDDKDILLLRESSNEIGKSIYTHRHNRGSSLSALD